MTRNARPAPADNSSSRPTGSRSGSRCATASPASNAPAARSAIQARFPRDRVRIEGRSTGWRLRVARHGWGGPPLAPKNQATGGAARKNAVSSGLLDIETERRRESNRPRRIGLPCLNWLERLANSNVSQKDRAERGGSSAERPSCARTPAMEETREERLRRRSSLEGLGKSIANSCPQLRGVYPDRAEFKPVCCRPAGQFAPMPRWATGDAHRAARIAADRARGSGSRPRRTPAPSRSWRSGAFVILERRPRRESCRRRDRSPWFCQPPALLPIAAVAGGS